MTRKRHAENQPEILLQSVVQKLEDEAPRSHRKALEALLIEGPLHASDEALHALQQPDAASWGELRAELRAFLRAIVRGGAPASFGLYEKSALTFHASGRPDGDVALGADGSVRDLVILQLVLLLHEIGFGQVRECRDVKCRRLFIRRYRRDYCSARCQKRVHAHLARLAERERTRQQEREQKLKRRRAR